MLCEENTHRSRTRFATLSVPPSRWKKRWRRSPARSREGRGVAAGARDLEGRLVDVGAEDLHLRRRPHRVHALAQQEGDRVDLLAGRAAGNPDAQRVRLAPCRRTAGGSRLLSAWKASASRKKWVTPISRSRKRSRRLLRVLPQVLDVGVERDELEDLHPALDAAQEGLLLVAAEVVPDALAQDLADGLPRLPGRGRLALVVGPARGREAGGVVDELRRDGLDRRAAGRRGRSRWRSAACRRGAGPAVGRLGDRQAAGLLDGPDAERAVAAGAGEDDGDGPLALVVGEAPRGRCRSGGGRPRSGRSGRGGACRRPARRPGLRERCRLGRPARARRRGPPAPAWRWTGRGCPPACSRGRPRRG